MKDIEKLAVRLLEKLNLNVSPIRVKTVARSLNIKLDSADLGHDISGVLVVDGGKPRIGYNKSHSVTRQRFSIAHEIGHYYLKHSGNKKNNVFVDGIKVMFRRDNHSNANYTQEMEANAFAAALLMPSGLVEKKFKYLVEKDDLLSDDKIIKIMAKHFKVSEMAMTYRLMNLDIII